MRNERTKWITFWLIVLVLALTALIGAGSVLAAYPAQADESKLVPLLQELLVPGVLGAVVGIIISYVVEVWPAYESLSAKWKRLAFFMLALIVGGVAGVGIAYFGKQPFLWDSILADALVAAMAAMSGGTLAHTRTL